MEDLKQRIAFSTLGCRLNQYETDSLVTSFKDAGYQVVEWGEAADAYVINTCTVTDKSDRKSRNVINQAIRAPQSEAPTAGKPVVVVTGCYVDHDIGRFSTDEGITYAIDNDRKSSIFHLLDAHFRGEVTDLTSLPTDRFAYRDARRGFHTRNSIKIQDGCDNFCTFCIIPSVRGQAVSRPAGEVVSQAAEMINHGAKEIVVTGVNIGRYESEEINFASLIEQILELDGDFRVRISSIEPDTWGDGFLPLLEHPKLCPHMHLCLQSGSDRMLLAMRRHYTVGDYLSFVEKVRAVQPFFNITTDIMVGFPGETDREFEETCDVTRKVEFSHIHTFPYSVREGTRAARMAGQVPSKIKAARSKIIRDISDEGKRRYRSKLLGKPQRVLIERIQDGYARGYGENYVPVEIPVNPSGIPIENTFIDVHLETLAEDSDPVFSGNIGGKYAEQSRRTNGSL
ncbi:MAG: tRNA (N(6)-L-threonylcarbamoyladenosine(37)-C(2))-methylthiotransferase MtaB [Spirochaetales bacterium]|jgi:threonylcarbamoyladenosine tRNA methylthiotransferase MtaB|nr:tRNA (N(6)-L-threonylcarbamoyladenosine(37)-C(2))-methylthiotransferase MtaB [Spirochaetales bacterium]